MKPGSITEKSHGLSHIQNKRKRRGSHHYFDDSETLHHGHSYANVLGKDDFVREYLRTEEDKQNLEVFNDDHEIQDQLKSMIQ